MVFVADDAAERFTVSASVDFTTTSIKSGTEDPLPTVARDLDEAIVEGDTWTIALFEGGSLIAEADKLITYASDDDSHADLANALVAALGSVTDYRFDVVGDTIIATNLDDNSNFDLTVTREELTRTAEATDAIISRSLQFTGDPQNGDVWSLILTDANGDLFTGLTVPSDTIGGGGADDTAEGVAGLLFSDLQTLVDNGDLPGFAFTRDGDTITAVRDGIDFDFSLNVFDGTDNTVQSSTPLSNVARLLDEPIFEGDTWTAVLSQTGVLQPVSFSVTLDSSSADDTHADIAGLLRDGLDGLGLAGFDNYQFDVVGDTIVATNLDGNSSFTFTVNREALTRTAEAADALFSHSLQFAGDTEDGEVWSLILTDANGDLFAGLTVPSDTIGGGGADNTAAGVAGLLFDDLEDLVDDGDLPGFAFSLEGDTITAVRDGIDFTFSLNVFDGTNNDLQASTSVTNVSRLLDEPIVEGDVWTAELSQTGVLEPASFSITLDSSSDDDTHADIAGLLRDGLEGLGLTGFDNYRFDVIGDTLVATNLDGNAGFDLTVSRAAPIRTAEAVAAADGKDLVISGVPLPGEQWQLTLSDTNGSLIDVLNLPSVDIDAVNRDDLGAVVDALFTELQNLSLAEFPLQAEFIFEHLADSDTITALRDGIDFSFGLNVVPATLSDSRAELRDVEIAENYSQRLVLNDDLAISDKYTIEIDGNDLSDGVISLASTDPVAAATQLRDAINNGVDGTSVVYAASLAGAGGDEIDVIRDDGAAFNFTAVELDRIPVGPAAPRSRIPAITSAKTMCGFH